MLIDTLGLRELGLLGPSDGIPESIAEICGLSVDCRFSNCTHIQELGCSVLKSVDKGALSEESYRSYLKLRKESGYTALSQVD